jgi:hypothetical protein
MSEFLPARAPSTCADRPHNHCLTTRALDDLTAVQRLDICPAAPVHERREVLPVLDGQSPVLGHADSSSGRHSHHMKGAVCGLVDPPALITNRAKRLRGRQNGEFGRPPLNMRYRLRATGTRDSAGAIRGSRQGRWDRAQAVERVRVPGRQHHRLRRQPARRLGARRRAEGGRSNAQRDPGTQLHLRCGETCERCSSLIGHSTPIRCPKRLERPQNADIARILEQRSIRPRCSDFAMVGGVASHA